MTQVHIAALKMFSEHMWQVIAGLDFRQVR
jgi:hypothetical protein